jgi:hypothetical protein
LSSILKSIFVIKSRILQLLGEKLEWLNNQDAFLSDIDRTIEGLQKIVDDLDNAIQAVDPFDLDVRQTNLTIEVIRRYMNYKSLEFKLFYFITQNISKNVGTAGNAVGDFSVKIKGKFASLKQVLPTSIGKCVSVYSLWNIYFCII